mgnify:CR=1 FL=1
MPGRNDQNESLRKMLNLLLAEDDESLRQTLSLYLASQGFRVYQAQSGDEAIEIALRKKISFSIMDINLPGLSGIDAFKLISRQVGAMPCIFMSGDASEEVMMNALSAGGFTFLSKPIQIELMRRSVERLITKYFRTGPS